MITWHVLGDAMHIWKDGQYVGPISISQAHRIMEKLAVALQEQSAREMQSK